MHDRDCLHRFLFERYPIRGHLVHLDAAWRALIEHREYPAPIRDTLGEAVAASLLLAATVKFEGVLSLQLQGDGPVHLMLAQCTSGLGVRGLARCRDAAMVEAGAAAPIADLIGAGNLTVTLETDDGAQRYQGIVPIAGQRLADSLEFILKIPGQLPTPALAACRCSGRVRDAAAKTPQRGSAGSGCGAAAIEDAWRRVRLIGETLTLKSWARSLM